MQINKLTYEFVAGDKPLLRQKDITEGQKAKEIDLSQPVEIIDSVVEEPKAANLPVIEKGIPIWLPVASAAVAGVIGWVIGYFQE